MRIARSRVCKSQLELLAVPIQGIRKKFIRAKGPRSGCGGSLRFGSDAPASFLVIALASAVSV